MKNEGYLMVDHRASPGIPAEKALRLGYHPSQVAEGQMFEAATYGCPHCGASVVKNPLRVRERAFCFQCNSNICDDCNVARIHPDYVHHTMQEIVDKVHSGKFTLSGSRMGRPILTPTGD